MNQRKADLLLVILQFGTILAILSHPSVGTVNYIQFVDAIGPIFFVSGIVIALLGIVSLRQNFSIFPSPPQESKLIVKGVYKFVRHPIYTGLILIALSFTLCRLSLLGIGLFLTLIIILYAKSSYEEKLLTKRFKDYEAYRQKTGRFFVKL